MAKKQLELALITHEVDDSLIPQRAVDGYVNATEMCKACGKKLNHYLENKTTKAFLAELEADAGIPVSALVIITKGGHTMSQGTWVHPHVAINLGQWCSPKFAVAVSKWVNEWVIGKFSKAELPYHIRRYMANMSEVPPDHFSMLNELTFGLVAPLESRGYTLPDKLVPDISEGRMFSQWLRNEKGIEPKEFPTYNHRYQDGRVVRARLYPMSLMEDFRRHFHDVWVPRRMVSYFKDKDPAALEFIAQAFPALANEIKAIES